LSATIAGGLRHAVESVRDWREERRREQQRRDVIAKHTKNGSPADARAAGLALAQPPSQRAKAAPPAGRDEDERAGGPKTTAGPRSFAPAKPPKVSLPAPPLPLSDPEPM